MQSIRSFCRSVYDNASKIFGVSAAVAGAAAVIAYKADNIASAACMSGALAVSGNAKLPTRAIAVVAAGALPVGIDCAIEVYATWMANQLTRLFLLGTVPPLRYAPVYRLVEPFLNSSLRIPTH